MTGRWLAFVVMALWMLGCAEATVRPFVDKSDASVDAVVDAGDEDAGEEDGGDDDDHDGGEEDGGDADDDAG